MNHPESNKYSAWLILTSKRTVFAAEVFRISIGIYLKHTYTKNLNFSRFPCYEGLAGSWICLTYMNLGSWSNCYSRMPFLMPTLCPLLHHAGIPWLDSDAKPQGSLFVSTSATLSSFYSGVLINLSIQCLDYIFSHNTKHDLLLIFYSGN